jgi:DNA-binding PucR family transcriptional regulator
LILQRTSAREVAADRALVVSSNDAATAIVPVRAAASLAEQIRSLVGPVSDLFASSEFAIGMSEPPARLQDLRQLLTLARHAQLAASTRPAKPSFATSREIASHRLLLALSPPELACSFRTCLLDPLTAYDAEHNAELVHTLDHFLGNSCAWQRTAEELNIHVNTLRYRVERIEQITHRQLSNMEDRVDLYLAMQLTADAVTPVRPPLLSQTPG